MKSIIIAFGIAALSAAEDLQSLLSDWQDEKGNHQSLIEDVNGSQITLFEEMLAQMKLLETRLNNTDKHLKETDGRVDTTESHLDKVSSDVDVLNSKKIVEDYFYTNQEAFNLVNYDCHSIASVDAYETFDFSANLSAPWGQNPDTTSNLHFWLNKNGVDVARNVADNAISPGDSLQNIQVSLLYREQLEQNAEYELCYVMSQDLMGRQIPKGWFQYGYKVYGMGHSFINMGICI